MNAQLSITPTGSAAVAQPASPAPLEDRRAETAPAASSARAGIDAIEDIAREAAVALILGYPTPE